MKKLLFIGFAFVLATFALVACKNAADGPREDRYTASSEEDGMLIREDVTVKYNGSRIEQIDIVASANGQQQSSYSLVIEYDGETIIKVKIYTNGEFETELPYSEENADYIDEIMNLARQYKYIPIGG